MQDVVITLPHAIMEHYPQGPNFEEMTYYEGYFCLWNNRCFIHTRSTLPMKAFDNGVGFGLWVEVGQETMDEFLDIEQSADDERYKAFVAKGRLANYWPGFDVYDLEVTLRVYKTDQKPYITEVNATLEEDDAFYLASTMENTPDNIARIQEVVVAYMTDLGFPPE